MILSNIHSIKRRIVAIILFVCTMTIGIGFTITTLTDISRIKSNIAEQGFMAAKLVGQSCVSALTFHYPDAAAKNLRTLESQPGMISAWIVAADGTPFAASNKRDTMDPQLLGSTKRSHFYKDGYLHLGQPIVYQDLNYGMIYLKISPNIKKEITSRIIIMAVLVAGLLFIAYVLANLAQKVISAPILTLAGTAETISSETNYSIRLGNKHKGEIGILYNAFNGMLDTLHTREKERDMAQKKLLFKEQVIESSTSAVVTTDLNGIVTYATPAFMKLFGYIKIENVVTRPFSNFLGDKVTFDLMLASLARQRMWSVEANGMMKDSTLFDAIISADTIFDPEGKPASFVVTVSDIAELRKTTRELEKENLVKTRMQSISDRLRGVQEIGELAAGLLTGLADFIRFQLGAVYISDESGVFFLAGSYALFKDKKFNPRFAPGESIIGQAAVEKKMICLSDIPQDYFNITSGSGQAVPKNILALPFTYNDEIVGVLELGAFNKFRPMDLKLLERLNQTVAIAVHTSRSNEKLQTLLEKTQAQSEELISQTEELQSQHEELQQTNEELEEQTQILEEQQEDIRKKNRELEKSGWLVEQKARDLEIISQYKSEFMANMSHELRTPLNSILLLSDVLSTNKDGNLSDKQIEFAENIHASGSDLLTLINDILDLSKVESGKMELFLENVAIDEFKDMARRTFEPVAAEKNLNFAVYIDKNLPEEIITDRLKAEQILKNLMSNAMKFTARGNVSLRIARPQKDDGQLPEDMPHEKTVAFTVEDTGIGIPEEKQPIVFEAFKQVDGTTSRKYGGTGLGLSISKEIAKLLGGWISLVSEPDKGSTFTLFLPDILEEGGETGLRASDISLKKIGEPPKEKPIPEIIEIDNCSLNDDRYAITYDDRSVLIIEDDPGFAKILSDRAHEQNFKVIIATDGEAGLHLADFYRPSAIILDLRLPGMDGWSVMDRLKKNLKTRHIPIHIISAQGIEHKAMKMGAVGFLTKPVSLNKLEMVFEKFKKILSKPVRAALVVEDDEAQCQSIKNIIGNGDVKVTCTHSGKEAEQLLRKTEFDCLILDLNLPDMSGFDLLSIIEKDKYLSAVPVIVYKAAPLNRKEKDTLQKYARSIIIKSVDSPESLLDETSLFLHRVESDLSEPRRKILRQIYEKESVLKDKKVLLVDDDMRNVFAINNILEEKGLIIKVGKNGLEALSALKSDPEFDLVLMDMMMPEMDGYQAIAEIRKQKKFKDLPIIALTAKAMKGDRLKCVEAGANDYLSKPVDKKKLLSMIRVWLY